MYPVKNLAIICLGAFVGGCASVLQPRGHNMLTTIDKNNASNAYALSKKVDDSLNQQVQVQEVLQTGQVSKLSIFEICQENGFEPLESFEAGMELVETVQDAFFLIENIKMAQCIAQENEDFNLALASYEKAQKALIGYYQLASSNVSNEMQSYLITSTEAMKKKYDYKGKDVELDFSNLNLEVSEEEKKESQDMLEVRKKYLTNVFNNNKGRKVGLDLLAERLKAYDDNNASNTKPKEFSNEVLQKELKLVKLLSGKVTNSKRQQNLLSIHEKISKQQEVLNIQKRIQKNINEMLDIQYKCEQTIVNNLCRTYNKTAKAKDGSTATISVRVDHGTGEVKAEIEVTRGEKSQTYDNCYLAISIPLENEKGQTVTTFVIPERYISKFGIEKIKHSETLDIRLARQIEGIGNAYVQGYMQDNAKSSGGCSIL